MATAFYVTGGFGATTQSQPTRYIFDGVWRTGPDLSAAVDHPGGAALGAAMYIAGGFTNLGPATARVFRAGRQPLE